MGHYGFRIAMRLSLAGKKEKSAICLDAFINGMPVRKRLYWGNNNTGKNIETLSLLLQQAPLSLSHTHTKRQLSRFGDLKHAGLQVF